MSVSKIFANIRHKSAKRAGRGIAANLGKTAGRGTKGQKSRTGSGRKIKPWFEGGQTPVFRKIAKRRGFSASVTKPMAITSDLINRFYKDGEVVSIQTLIEKKVLRPSETKNGVKVIKRNPLKAKVTFEGVTTSQSLL